jgi:acetate kinase
MAGSADLRDILAADARGEAQARLALELFVHRIVMMVGAYLTLLQGRGALVFGGGIGANSAVVRSRIAAGLAVWDVRVDRELNEAGREGLISHRGRPVYVFRTDEESVIAGQVAAALDASGHPGRAGRRH